MTVKTGVVPATNSPAPKGPASQMTTKLNLHQKISKVMSEIQYLKKDGNVAFGQTKYPFLSEEKITTELRDKCIKYGLILFPNECVPEKIGNVTQVRMQYKIIDIDTGDFETFMTCGQGADSQDKGAAKAMTMAFKYMQKQAFMIPSGNDPDQISSDELDKDPGLMPMVQSQIDQIKALATSLQWNKEVMGAFVLKQVGTSNMAEFTMAMGNKVIWALQEQAKLLQQPKQ